MTLKLGGIGHIPYSQNDPYYAEVCDYLGAPRGSVPAKEDIYKQLGYIPLPTVLKMHQSRATHRILAGGNRSGKSQGGTWEIIPYLFWESRGWVVSRNYDLAEVIIDKIIMILTERLGCTRQKQPYYLRPFEFCYTTREHQLTLWTGATLEVKSAENPDSMHGKALDYVVIDEASLFPFALYDTRLVPRLVDSGGWILSLGTFEYLQGEWFEEYFEIGQTENEFDIASWCHPTEDNYHTYRAEGGETTEDIARIFHDNPRRIQEMNPELSWPLKPGEVAYIYNVDLAWLEKEKARIAPDVYAARYEARPAANQYLVFPTWRVMDFAGAEARARCEFDESLPVYVAIDPGGTYAVAVIQLKRFEDAPCENEMTRGFHLCVIDELYFQTTTTSQEVFEAMKHKEWWPNLSRKVDWWDPLQGVIDVTAKEQQRAFRNLGHQESEVDRLNLRGRKVQVLDGIKTHQHYLDTHTFWSHPSNRFLHLEHKRYHWPEASLGRVDTQDPRKGVKPVNEWNHLLKAIWYFEVIKFGCYGKSTAPAAVSLEQILGRKNQWHNP